MGKLYRHFLLVFITSLLVKTTLAAPYEDGIKALYDKTEEVDSSIKKVAVKTPIIPQETQKKLDQLLNLNQEIRNELDGGDWDRMRNLFIVVTTVGTQVNSAEIKPHLVQMKKSYNGIVKKRNEVIALIKKIKDRLEIFEKSAQVDSDRDVAKSLGVYLSEFMIEVENNYFSESDLTLKLGQFLEQHKASIDVLKERNSVDEVQALIKEIGQLIKNFEVE